jgi:hypothetical protein
MKKKVYSLNLLEKLPKPLDDLFESTIYYPRDILKKTQITEHFKYSELKFLCIKLT